MAESSMFYTPNRLVFGESRRNVGTGKSAKWLFLFFGITILLIGNRINVDAKLDDGLEAMFAVGAEAQEASIANGDSRPIEIGEPYYKEYMSQHDWEYDMQEVNMPLLVNRLNQIIQHIIQHEPKCDNLKPLKEVVQQHINQTADGIPVDLAVDLCKMRSGVIPITLSRHLPGYFAKRLVNEEFGRRGVRSRDYSRKSLNKILIQYIDEAFATLIIN
ncbi:probable 3-hydroxyacyl dehydrogenase, putative [Babesia ovis]|uniref:Probable 3-hydroxyacyl dehydrogenase, putative n=1 Tax=Babesia ovis TaxID=5869 RepID=A0A9W5TCT0_BABOV|nr:probable 3-hydroxyacyl dehydrogenase, putative [Babesia ovis]